MEISSFDDAAGVGEAVAVVRAGGVVAAHFGTVFALIVDGGHAGVAEKIMQIKGAARGHKPLGICVAPELFPQLIDVASLPEQVQRLVTAPWFAGQLASMVAVRAPANPAAEVPDHLVSTVDGYRWVQVFDPQRMPGVSELVGAMGVGGVEWVAATSMNEAGRTEIVDRENAVDFAVRHGVEMLFQPLAVHDASGSLPILELNPDGLRLDRHGIISLPDLEAAIGEQIDATGAIPAHFPPLQVPRTLLRDLTPEAATAKLLELLYPLHATA
jgi:tRNA A37 threonylcarbamoyladenosine synthetase subunit TsaC/SUA5/YrdC